MISLLKKIVARIVGLSYILKVNIQIFIILIMIKAWYSDLWYVFIIQI